MEILVPIFLIAAVLGLAILTASLFNSDFGSYWNGDTSNDDTKLKFISPPMAGMACTAGGIAGSISMAIIPAGPAAIFTAIIIGASAVWCLRYAEHTYRRHPWVDALLKTRRETGTKPLAKADPRAVASQNTSASPQDCVGRLGVTFGEVRRGGYGSVKVITQDDVLMHLRALPHADEIIDSGSPVYVISVSGRIATVSTLPPPAQDSTSTP